MIGIVIALLVGVPLLAAVATLLLSGGRRQVVVLTSVGGTAVALAMSVLLVLEQPWREGQAFDGVLLSVPTGVVDITVATKVDGLSAAMVLMVCIVALLVQIYSVAYMADEVRYSSYAALVSLFTAAMLLVVVAGDLFVLVVGWEVMGICSYFLIGQYWERADARSAAVKAFLVTRLGDVGFLFGIFVLGLAAGSFRIDEVIAAAPEMSSATLTLGTLLLVCGVCGKSAQFPLHTWLPDAMAGPTPISALIHAATMVAAGVFLIARLYPVFLLAPITLAVLAVIAAVTMFGAALAALAQDDIKRVLAYSTVSQLAYMVGALATGSRNAAIFMLLAHAAFKALLFLAAGAVIHSVGTNLMSEMGGLRSAMRTTFVTMTLGLAALVGIPPLAGFFSKESVLTAAEETAFAHAEGPMYAWTGWLILVVGLTTVAVTAAYSTRLWLRTFFGRWNAAEDAVPHATPAAMLWPLILLSVPTVAFGVVGLRAEWLPTWLGPVFEPESLAPAPITAAAAVVLALVGGFWMYSLWREEPAQDPILALPPLLRDSFATGFGLDAAYDSMFVRPVRAMARDVVRIDDNVVDAAVRGSGRNAFRLGGRLRLTENGNVQGYLTGALTGFVLIAVAVLVVVGG
ncbi:MAG TPA: NADH-quinone oxidoreductase subunit L [Actinomycetes bacterium]|nr:NADH-quinone oxidoreductase subunit L [Actinomycetes bacterium]